MDMGKACKELVEWWNTGICKQDGEVESVRLELEAKHGEADMRDSEREITNRLVRHFASADNGKGQDPSLDGENPVAVLGVLSAYARESLVEKGVPKVQLDSWYQELKDLLAHPSPAQDSKVPEELVSLLIETAKYLYSLDNNEASDFYLQIMEFVKLSAAPVPEGERWNS